MPIILNTSMQLLERFSERPDFSALEDAELQYQAQLDAWFDTDVPTTYTTLTSTLVEMSQGAFVTRVEGSGIGPVSSASALEDALDAGLANGQITRIAVSTGGTEILELTPGATGYSLQSGTTTINITGALPTSLAQVGEIQNDLNSLAGGFDTLTPAERTALAARMSSYGIDGLEIVHEGQTLMSASLAEDALSLSVMGFTLSASGTFPGDFGALVETLFQLYDGLEGQGLTSADNLQIEAFGDDGSSFGVFSASVQVGPSLPTGRYFIEVSEVSGTLTGDYGIYLLNADGSVEAVTPGTEGTDAPSDFTTPYVLTPDSGFLASIGTAGDTDMFAFDYTDGTTLALRAVVNNIFDTLTSLQLSEIRLTAPDGTLLMGSSTSLADIAEDPTPVIAVGGEGFFDLFLDSADAGVENDLFYQAYDSALVLGFGGNDVVIGSMEYDRLIGGTGDDTLVGEDGDDTLEGGAGADSLTAGAGFDTLVGGWGPDLMDGGDDLDMVSYAAVPGAVNVNLTTGVATGEGNDTLVAIEDVDGTAFSDQIIGSESENWLFGNDGDDTLGGNGGEDWLTGNLGDDLVYGGAGNDSVEGNEGRDTVYGGTGDDTLEGGAGADLMGGGAGDDQMLGGEGWDAIWTTGGNDSAAGGAGNDTLGGAGGNDLLFGDEGDDELWGSLGDDTLNGGDGDDTLGGAAGADVLNGNLGDDELWGAGGDDILRGGDGADRLGGGADNDSLEGNLGNDSLFGGLGNDTVLGGFDDDLIFGAAGDDSLAGGAGADTLWAGPGNDTIVYGAGDGADLVEGFVAADDRLELDPALWTGTLTAVQVVTQFGSDVGADYVLDFGGGNTITLTGQAGITGLDLSIDIL